MIISGKTIFFNSWLNLYFITLDYFLSLLDNLTKNFNIPKVNNDEIKRHKSIINNNTSSENKHKYKQSLYLLEQNNELCDFKDFSKIFSDLAFCTVLSRV